MPDQNAYDSLIQNDTAQRVRVSMMDAVDKQPDTEAKLQGLAKTYGMPVDAVRLRQAEIERQARLDALDYDTLANRYPKTANALANPNAAAIAHDDVDNMSGLERAARGLFGGAVEGLGMLASGAGVGLNILQRNLTQAAGALLPTPRGGPMTEGALDSLNGSLMGEDWKYVGGLTKRTARQDIMVPEAQRTFTDQVLGGLGQIGVQIPASIFLGPAPLYLQGLDAMDEKVSKDNAPQWKKDLATVGGAAITGITEKWALDRVLGPAAEPVKNALAAALARIGIAAASEGGQEFSENLLQDLLRKGVTNPDAPVQIGDSVQEGAVGATVGGIVRSIIEGALHVRARGARDEQQAQQAEARAQVLGKLAKLAEASKVRERDPAQFAQFMQSVVEEGVPHLYVDANALAKAVDLNAVALALPSVAEQITQAMATGGDVVIPTQELLTAGPGNEFMQSLIDNARTTPEAMSPVQAREFMQGGGGDQMKADIDKVLSQKEQDQSWRQMRDDLRDEIKAQLDGVKRFTSDVNLQKATLMANFYAVTAAKLGQTPQELATKYGLLVQAKEVQGGQQLDQGPALDEVLRGWAAAGVEHAVRENNDRITVSKIVVPEGARGQGAGTAAMRQLLEYADRTGKHVVLSPSADFGGDKGRLTKFYKGLGFVENKGKNRAFSTGESMYRQALGKVLQQGKRDDYTLDLFGVPEDKGAGAPAGEPADGRQGAPLFRDDAPGRFATRTEVVEENTRTLGIERVNSPQEAAQALAYLHKSAVERFDALVTDKDGNPLAIVGAFKGALSQTSVYPATVAAEAFRIQGAANIWFAHNHPSGVPALSRADLTLNDKLAEVFRGSEIKARGLFAIGGAAESGGRRWNFQSAEAGEGLSTGVAEKTSGGAKVPVVERVFADETKLGPSITGPAGAKDAVRSLSGEDSGVLLLDAQNTPLAFVPVEQEITNKLRGDGRMDALWRAVSLANAGAAIIVNRDYSNAQAENLAGFFNAADVRVLDVMNVNGDKIRSWAETGDSFGSDSFFQSAPLPETIEIDGKQRPTTNSNGQPIAATEEGVRNFWAWFGDSKVVDASGKPLVVYHGTPTVTFTEFDVGNVGAFFSDRFDVAASYAGRYNEVEFDDEGAYTDDGTDQGVYEAYLAIRNPLVMDWGGGDWGLGPEGIKLDDWASRAKRAGHDGLIVENVVDSGWLAPGLVDGAGTGRVFVAFRPEQIKSAIGNSGEFDPTNPSILRQQARGSITLPEDLTKSPAIISLFKGANLSTFIHESGHFFLEVQLDLAARIQAQIDAGATVTEGERSIVNDANILLTWFGIKGSETTSQLTEWFALDLEGKRPHHEKFARGFEAYGFEGNAPSLELQSMFQTFREWMLGVYKTIKALRVEISDDVRGVMDRMLASTQAIQEAEAARRMGPLFATREQAGMTPDEFAAYNALGNIPTQSAISELQARGLRDMRWLANAKDKKLKELQAQYKTLRSGVRKEIRAEVMRQPVYRAWQFLTGKGDAQETAQPDAKAKSDPKALDAVEDSLFKAIAKLGGLSKDEAISLWGVDPKEKIESGVFGAPVLRKTGGLSVDTMAARLTEVGYLLPDENGAHDVNALFEAFDSERRGSPVYSLWHEYKRPDDVAPVEPLPENVAFGKLNVADLTEQYGTKEGGPLGKLQALKMTSATRGIHPDVVAEKFEFSSGDEMVQAILGAEPPASAIEGMTDQRMLERFGDLGTPEGLTKAADRAIHNEARARFVATEIRALETGMRVRAPGATGKSTVDVLATVARQQAEAIVARTKVRDLRPGQYTAAEARAARAAEKAMLAGKTEDALAEKRHQIINLQAAKATMNAQDEMDKTVKYLRKFDGKAVRGNLPADYLAQIDMLLEKFDLRGVSGAEIDRTVALRTWVQSRLAAGEIPVISDTLLTRAERTAYEAAINARDDQGNLAYPDDEERIKLLAEAVERSAMRAYKDMTVEEMRGLRDTIKQIEHLARLKNKMLTAKDGRTYEATRDALVTTIKANAKQSGKNTRTDNTLVGGWLESVKQFGASHIKVATWLRIFDGGQDGGAWWNTVLRPANERASFEATRRADATARLMDILGPVLKNVGLIARIGKGRSFPELGTSLNWEERFTIACNYGNESNLQRLMGGGIAGVAKSLNMQQVQAVLRSLTAAEWRAVQGVWDHFETYRPEIAAKEMRVNGVEPEWITARPFDIQTADGQTLSLRGGYYPVVFDPKTSLMAQQHNDAQAAKDAMKAAYSAATTRRSFTNARVEEVTGRPLLLNLRGLYSGTNDVIHDLAWHEWVIDMNKLMRSQAIDEAIREHYGANVKKELTKWRDDIVAGSKKLDHGIENAAGWARKFTSSAALTYNVMSAVLQPLGVTQSFSRVGTTWVAKGIGQYLLAGPVEATRMVQGKSEFMANRTRTMFRDLNELRNRVEGQTAARELMGRYGYFATMHMQMVVDVPTWIGGYEKAIAAGHDEDTAIALADQGVKDSQGGGEEVDQAGITRGGPLVKLFTAFYEFMNTQANVLYLANATSKTKADAFMHFALVGLATPILAAAVKAALTPGDSGDWDEEHVFRTMLREGLANLFGMVAFGREFTGLVDKMLGTNKGVSYSGPTGLRIIPDTIKLGEQAAQGDLDDAFRKSFLNVLGDFSGIPAVQINRTITGAEALSEGETQNPGALVFGYQKP